MFREMMKSKIHGATVTHADLNYTGSLAIDQDLMEEADLLPHEKIQVVNLENGERFETYALPAPRGSGTIGLNGGAAHKGKVGDRVLVISYATMSEEEARAHTPQVLVVEDVRNRKVRRL
ncbi:MAG: aspartate 1-decarboxylase [Planctomycetota bacterium]